MRKLTPDEIRALPDGHTCHVKLTRLFWPKAHVEFEGKTSLYVQRYKGTVVTIALNGPVDWAEYDPRRSFEHDGSLVTEDYQMEIFQLTDEHV